jgi:hypothetical protein
MWKKAEKRGKKRNICGLFSAGSATNPGQFGTWTAKLDLASARPGLAKVEFMFDFLKGFGGEATLTELVSPVKGSNVATAHIYLLRVSRSGILA